MLIFRLANILKKLQLNIEKYDFLIYHITKRATLKAQSATILLPITNFDWNRETSNGAHRYTYINIFLSLSAISSDATSVATKFGSDYTDLSLYDYYQQQQLYSNVKITHQYQNQQPQQQQQQKNEKFHKNIYYNQRFVSRLLNNNESGSCCYIIKYFITNNLFKDHKLIINRKMSTIVKQETATTTSSSSSSNNVKKSNDEIITNGSNSDINNCNTSNDCKSNGLIANNDEKSPTIDSTTNCNKNIEENDNKSSCFSSSLADIIQFLELVGGLKHTKRTGWVLRDIKDCESISGHMYRMSMMTFLLNGSEGLNQIRCMELALVHDLAESIVGDLTPFCGVSKEDKKKREMDAMENICNLIQPRGERMWQLFQEYEAAETPESKFVKDLDRLDLVLQAFEYEKRDSCIMKHQEFFDSNEGKFEHPFVKKLVNEIYEQRKELAEKLGATSEMYEQNHQQIEHKQQNGHSSGDGGECPEDLSQKKVTTTS